jgi:TonB family protein
MKVPFKYPVTFLAVFLCTLGIAQPQGTLAPARNQAMTGPKYANSSEGLQQLLTDVREAAKSGDMARVALLLKEMEVPNCEVWIHKMYGADSSDVWMRLCNSRALGAEEKSMREAFATLAQEKGEISTRKINDNPDSVRTIEGGWLKATRQPLDIYFASWKTAQAAQASPEQPIGYFMFVDDAFRWESDLQFGTPKAGNSNFVPPKLVRQVAPVYPSSAAAQHVSGTVRVYFNVGADGVVKDVHALEGEGLSNDPILKKAAEDAVVQWRYEPATVDGVPAETTAMTTNIVFSPRN